MIPQFLDERLPDRFWNKVQPCPMSGCWIWMAFCDGWGYGRFRFGNRSSAFAHRIAYLTLVGPVADGLELDHRCRTKPCVNPSHLRAVTHFENVMRGDAPPAVNARATTCRRGHDFTSDNVRISRRGCGATFRSCRACVRAYQNEQYRLRSAA